MTRPVEGAPARQVGAGQLAPYVLDGEGKLACHECQAVAIGAAGAVPVGADAKRVAPPGRPGHHDGPRGLPPPPGPAELDPGGHAPILTETP